MANFILLNCNLLKFHMSGNNGTDCIAMADCDDHGYILCIIFALVLSKICTTLNANTWAHFKRS